MFETLLFLDSVFIIGKGNARRNTLSSFFQMPTTLQKNTKVVNNPEEEETEEDRSNEDSLRPPQAALVSSCLGNRSVCGNVSGSSSYYGDGDQDDNADDDLDKSMASEPPRKSSRGFDQIRQSAGKGIA